MSRTARSRTTNMKHQEQVKRHTHDFTEKALVLLTLFDDAETKDPAKGIDARTAKQCTTCKGTIEQQALVDVCLPCPNCFPVR